MILQNVRNSRRAGAAFILGSLSILGFLDSCDDLLVNVTRYVDPCGTFLANCTPGSFETEAAEVGDYCVDPACTVPGQCGGGQPLGTITDLCP